MKELIDRKPDINVQDNEYKRLLGYPSNYELIERACELADWARDWYTENGKPWVFAVKSDEIETKKEIFTINGIELSSRKLYKQFKEADVECVMIVAVSAGKECEEKARQLWNEGKPDEYFFLEVYGSAVVEHLVTTTGFRFCEWAEENNMRVLPHYSPGYQGWNVEDQKMIMQLIQQNRTKEIPGKIELFETGMLNPKKSMLAVFGITKQVGKVQNLKELVPCETCSLTNCEYRRISYKHYRRQIEDVGRLQSFEQMNFPMK